MKAGNVLVWLLAAFVVIGVVGLGALFFVQQTALDAGTPGKVLGNGDVMFDISESTWVQQSAVDGIPFTCDISKHSASCYVGKVKDEDGVLVHRTFARNDWDLSSVGWGNFGNCANWMTFYGCTASKCESFDGAVCGGGSQQSTVQCSLDSHCVEKKLGNRCYAGKCSTSILTNECAKKGDYYCKGEGAVYRCTEASAFGVTANRFVYVGNVHAQRGVCQLSCKTEGPVSSLDSQWSQFCNELTPEQKQELTAAEKERIDIAQSNLTTEQIIGGLDSEGNLRGECTKTEIKVNIGSSTICLPNPIPPPVVTDVCGDDACTGSETKESCPADCDKTPPSTCGNGNVDAGETCVNCPKDQPLDKCRSGKKCDMNPTLPECKTPLSLWEFIKLFIKNNWILVTVFGTLVFALVLTLVLTRKRRGGR